MTAPYATNVQLLRSSTAGGYPATGSRMVGEPWLNMADYQLGFIDSTKTAQKLLPARYFVATASYAVGDMVVYSGELYQANTNITPGAFNASQWNLMLSVIGGTLTGQLVLAADPTAPLAAATKQYVDTKVALAGGTMTGELIIAPPSGQSANLALQPQAGYAAYIFGLKGANLRWAVEFGDATPETGGNVGSNFVFVRYNDAGVLIDSPITIARSTGIMSVTQAPVNGNDVVNKTYADNGAFVVGDIKVTAAYTYPANWLLCDGTVYANSAYPLLFAAIGYTYGGNGSTTFAVPNLVGKVIVGAGSGWAYATTGGEYSHVLSVAEMPSHTHGVTQTPHGHGDPGHTHTDSGHTHQVAFKTPGPGSSGSFEEPQSYPSTGSYTTSVGQAAIQSSVTGIQAANANLSIGYQGLTNAHNNIQPYMALNVLIRAA